MAHSPALDVAGLLQPGKRMLLRRNSPSCKTPYAMQLLEDEGELVLANPMSANRIAKTLIDAQLIPALRMFKVLRTEVTRGDSRFDLHLQHRKDSTRELLVEVKHVSTVDVASDAPEPSRKSHFIVRGKGSIADGTYARTALFPVDRAQQKHGAEDVVSARAIKHVIGMRKLQGKGFDCCVLFLIGRGDAESFRPCEERCPVFSREIGRAVAAGVKVLAPQVTWDWKGTARFKRMLPVRIPSVSLAKVVSKAGRAVKKHIVKKRPASQKK